MVKGNGKSCVKLSARIRALRDDQRLARDQLKQLGFESASLEKRLEQQSAFLPQLPICSVRYTCIVCKMPRLRLDVTGLTCGNAQCLAGLESVVSNIDAHREEFEEFKEERAKIQAILSEIAELLGMDPEGYESLPAL